jgi:putative hydrolase of the HAD superfamily
VTVRPLRLLGDPLLRTPCDPVVRFDDALARLVTDLLDTVAEPGRAGLAANQIGSGLAVFSYNVDGEPGYVINPRVVELRDSIDGPEACLSVPGISAIRTRAEYAVVEGVDLGKEPVVVAGAGEFARCLQHETDHLRGKLYIDDLTGAERRRVMRHLTWRLPRSPTLDDVPEMPRVTNETGNGAGPPSPFRGVIWDWGGVMTNPIRDMVAVWLDDEDVDHEHYTAVMRPWVIGAYDQNGDTNPIHALERGECTTEEFEQLLASRIARRDGVQMVAEGLLTRMFAGSTMAVPMQEAVQAIRTAGLRTALLSNSWGMADYPRHLFPDMFDVVVISGEVGMRKPEERIFRHAAGLLGLDPAECVFIDDIEVNIKAAEAIGMTAILHRDPAATLARLSELLGLALTG